MYDFDYWVFRSIRHFRVRVSSLFTLILVNAMSNIHTLNGYNIIASTFLRIDSVDFLSIHCSIVRYFAFSFDSMQLIGFP